MLCRLAILAASISALAFGAERRIDVNTTEQADLAAGGTVNIVGSMGELNVEGWDKPTVEIEVNRYTWSDKPEKAKARLAEIQVKKSISGNELTITTMHKRFTGAHVDYRIRIPRNAKLVVHQGMGAVTLYDLASDIDVNAKWGDIVVMLPEPARYEIEAKSKFGGVYSDFAAEPKHTTMFLGRRENVEPAGTGDTRHIHLTLDSGTITIQKMSAPALLSSK